MNPQDILEHFILLTGLDKKEAPPWLPLCSRYARQLRAQLKNPEQETQNAALLSTVAAEMAYAKYTEICAARETESFSAGDITVRAYGEGAVRAAKAVAEEALCSINDLLDDRAFVFRKC